MEEAGLSIITEGNEPPTPSSELLMHLAAMLCFTLLISLHIVSIAVDLSPDAFISAMENNCTGHENALQEDGQLNDSDNNPPGNNSPKPESNPPEPDSNPPEPESNPQQQSHNHPASNAQQQGNNAAESNAQQPDNKQQQADANTNASTNTGQMVDDDPIKSDASNGVSRPALNFPAIVQGITSNHYPSQLSARNICKAARDYEATAGEGFCPYKTKPKADRQMVL